MHLARLVVGQSPDVTGTATGHHFPSKPFTHSPRHFAAVILARRIVLSIGAFCASALLRILRRSRFSPLAPRNHPGRGGLRVLPSRPLRLWLQATIQSEGYEFLE